MYSFHFFFGEQGMGGGEEPEVLAGIYFHFLNRKFNFIIPILTQNIILGNNLVATVFSGV